MDASSSETDRSRTTSRAAALCAGWLALCLLFFAPALPRDRVLAPLDILDTLWKPWAQTERIEVKNTFQCDAISQYIPYDWAIYDSLRQDGFVGWNPNAHNGTAIRENAMVCPGSLRHLFYRFLPFWDAWDWGRIAHFFLAGLGMVLLLLETGIKPAFVLPGAIAFAFSSQFVVWLYSDVMLSGCCWSPWMLWSLLRLGRRATHPERRWPALVPDVLLAAVFIGQGLRGGFLHTVLFNGSLLVVFFLSEFSRPRSSATAAVPRRKAFACAAAVIGGLLLALPVLLDVVPPAIAGGHALRSHSILSGLKQLPTLVTSILPFSLGSAQTMDANKAFGGNLLDVKFAGGTMFALALLAAFDRSAPRLPKWLFVLFLAIPFTPLAKWYYSRCFVLSALGIAWLGAWRLGVQTERPRSPAWRWILRLFSAVVAAWLLVSVALEILGPSILPKLEQFTIAHVPADRTNRTDWLVGRTARFLAEIKIWHPWNLASLLALGLGLWSASRIHRDEPRNNRFAILLLVCCFAEMALFAARTLTVSPRPDATDGPYGASPCMTRLKSHLSNGSVLFWQDESRKAFDYMQINTPSAFGIRQCNGYESIQPAKLAPQRPAAFEPEDFALAGISHVSTPPGEPFPNADAWHLVEASVNYDLYENPAFRSLFLARLADGTEAPLFADAQTPNSIHLILPAGTQSLRIAMTHHPGWRYRLGNGSWNPLPPSQDGLLASEISLPASLQQATDLHLRFR